MGTKRDELANPNSCLNRADDSELIFVLRERDVQFADIVDRWASQRLDLVYRGVKPRSDIAVAEEALRLAKSARARRREEMEAARG